MGLLNTEHIFLKPACIPNRGYDDLKVNTIQPPMTKMEINELISVTKGLDKAEIEIVLDHIPVEMCFNRIAKELKKNKAFIDSIRGAVSGFDGVVE